jgi:putative endonuclease
MSAPGSAAGTRAEALGAAFLEARGLVIVERNWRRRCGELDLIAREGDTLVFVEVRLRRNQAYGGAAASIHPGKRARLIAAASLYLSELQHTPCCRFDALLFDALADSRVEWLRDIISV